MPENIPPIFLPLPQLEAQYRASAVRLHRVNEALSRWEEYACAQAMPADLRPAVPRPTLSRTALVELAWMPGERLRALDTAIRAAMAARRAGPALWR